MPAPVVGDHDAVGPMLDGESSVGRVHDSLEQDRELRDRTQPRKRGPTQVGVETDVVGTFVHAGWNEVPASVTLG